MQIRRAEERDHLKIAELIKGGPSPDWAWVISNEAIVENGIVAVENHDDIVGYADCQSCGALTRAYVRHDRRRQGIGRILIQELLKQQQVLIFDSYDLTEFERSTVDFLNACGFVLDADTREFTLGVNDDSAIVMKMSVRVRVLHRSSC